MQCWKTVSMCTVCLACVHFERSSFGIKEERILMIEGKTVFFFVCFLPPLSIFVSVCVAFFSFISALADHVDPTVLFWVWLPSVTNCSTITANPNQFRPLSQTFCSHLRTLLWEAKRFKKEKKKKQNKSGCLMIFVSLWITLKPEI